MSELRKSGIDVLGEIPWGSHFCQFYETKQDLLDLLIPYFKAGLENNEFCLWVTCNPLTKENAIEELRKAIPNFDHLAARQSIEILTHVDWYLRGGQFNPGKIIKGWKEKLQTALAKGYDGMRVNGNETWLEQEDWEDFMKYERELNNALHGRRMIVLCTYPLSKTTAASILDVSHSHDRAISKRKGHWEILEDPEIKEIKQQLKKKNYELEQKVMERTQKLAKTVQALQDEISGREKIEAELKRSELRYRTLIEQASDAIIITDGNGRLIEVNPSFCKMVGYTEKELLGMDITTLIDPDHLKTDPLRFDLLSEGKSLFRERLMKKRDGTVFPMEEHVKMLDDKRILAIVRDITERRQTEDALRRSENRTKVIIDAIPTMAWSLQPDGTVDFANQRWLDYAGEGKIENPTLIIHPEDLPGVMEKWLVNRGAGKPYDDEMRLQRADGEYRWFLVRTAPLHDEQGNVVKWYGVSIDIEDSKRAEDELRLAYQRLSYHFENTPLAVIEFDKDLFIKRWSKSAEGIFGWKEFEALGKNVYDHDFPIIYVKDIPAVDKINEQLTKGIVNRNLSLNRNYTKDGTIIYCEWYNSVLRDEQGNVITILSLVHNVTERKAAEDALRKSEDRLRLVIDTIPALVLSALPDGSVDFINQRYREFTGLSLNEVRGWGWVSAVIHPDDREKILDEWHTALATGKPMKTETRLRRPGGGYCWMLIYAVPLRDDSGNIVRWYGTKTDITELKQAEEELRRSEDRTRLIIDTIPIMAWSISSDGTPDFVNKQWKNYTGLSKEEQVKNPNQPIHPEDLPRILESWEKSFTAGNRVEDEMRVRRADGQYRWFLARTDPLRDDKGNVIKWYGVAIDIEDSKRAEEALRQSYEEIRRLTEHLQEIREEERTAIAREIHDELGQQLTAIKMDVAWIDKKTPGEAIDIKRKLKNIIELLDGSNQSIRRILSELRPRILDDHGLLEAIEWLGRQFTETTGIPVKFTSPEKDIKVSEQMATSIFRVCQETFTNITRYAHAKNVSNSINIIEENIILVIEDDGIGFDMASVQTKKSFGILGMKERVLSLGGKFELISSPGKGTKITVSLPDRA